MKRLAHYSQYFLRDPDLIKELIGHSSLKKTDTVLDIGAGSGVISSVLASRCKKVIAVEAEPRMAQKLRDNMTAHDNVVVKETDFMTMDLPSGRYKVFANIPFHLSSEIVRKLTESTNAPEAIYLIVQKQFAQKLLPNSDRFTGQLGMLIGPLYNVRIRRPLKRTDYFPHPNVDTVFIEMIRRSEPMVSAHDMPRYRSLVTNSFSTPKVFAKTPREAVGLPSDVKPSQMKLKHWIRLFEAMRRTQRPDTNVRRKK